MPRGKDTILLLAVLAAVGLSGCSLGGDENNSSPQIGVPSGDKNAAAKLGFPAAATRNTIRVGGGDATSDAAGVASALFPATDTGGRPTAVVLVDKNDWQGAVSASTLAGSPIGAPLLLTNGGDLPSVTSDTLNRLKPKGSDLSKGAQVIRIGRSVARPGGFRTAVIEGDDAYERAAAIDRFFSAARGKPSGAIVIYSGEKPEFAVPAGAYAARSGNSALPVKADAIPDPVKKAIKEHGRPDVYVLGPTQAVSDRVLKLLKPLGKSVRRISGKTPVENAIAFARYQRGRFGWGVVVPGYNFTLANTTRSLDAAPAAALATKGVFAPLLLTDDAAKLPKALDDYFSSVQPGYESDPAQAVYNRVWVLGDDKAISVKEQARLDQLTELIPVQTNAP